MGCSSLRGRLLLRQRPQREPGSREDTECPWGSSGSSGGCGGPPRAPHEPGCGPRVAPGPSAGRCPGAHAGRAKAAAAGRGCKCLYDVYKPCDIYCVYIYVPINRLFSTSRLRLSAAVNDPGTRRGAQGGAGPAGGGQGAGHRGGQGRAGREGAGQGRAKPGPPRSAPGAAAAGGRRAGACAEPSPARPLRCPRSLRSAAGPSAPQPPPR